MRLPGASRTPLTSVALSIPSSPTPRITQIAYNDSESVSLWYTVYPCTCSSLSLLASSASFRILSASRLALKISALRSSSSAWRRSASFCALDFFLGPTVNQHQVDPAFESSQHTTRESRIQERGAFESSYQTRAHKQNVARTQLSQTRQGRTLELLVE